MLTEAALKGRKKSQALMSLVVLNLHTYLLLSVSTNSSKGLPLSLRSSCLPLPLQTRCALILRLPKVELPLISVGAIASLRIMLTAYCTWKQGTWVASVNFGQQLHHVFHPPHCGTV